MEKSNDQRSEEAEGATEHSERLCESAQPARQVLSGLRLARQGNPR